MSAREAGWYPDPTGEPRQRYWDGDSWSEYYAPVVGEAPALRGERTAAQDYPYLATAAQHGASAPAVRAAGTGWPTPASAHDGATMEFTSGTRRSSATRWAMVVGSVLVVALVAGLIALAIRGPQRSTPSFTASATSTSEDDVSGTVALEEQVVGSVPQLAAWVGALTITQETTVLFEVEATSARGDLVLTIEQGSTEIARNDDRRSLLAETFGGDPFDPLLASTLAPGDYEVRVTDFSGRAGDFELTTTILTEHYIDGDTGAFTGGPAIGTLDIPADGRYEIGIRGVGDLVLVLLGPTGAVVEGDGGAGQDPVVRDFFRQGVWTLLVYDHGGGAGSFDVTVAAL